MYKSLCVAALLVGLLALTGRTSIAVPAPFTSPLIVAKGRLVNQTAPIPTTTIFTPNQTGLYRISIYATLLNSGSGSGAWWSVNVSWSDDAGPQRIDSFLVGDDQTIGQFVQFWNNSFNVAMGGPVTTFEAKAGEPITYSVAFSNGQPDNSAYSLYYTLERLE